MMMSMTVCGRATAVRARGGARGTRARARVGARAARRRDVGTARAIQEDRGLSAMGGDSNGDGDAFEGRVREALMEVRAARDAVAKINKEDAAEGASEESIYEMKSLAIGELPSVSEWLREGGLAATLSEGMEARERFLMRACVACGQAHLFEPAGDEIADDGARAAALASSLEILSKVETFYDMIGGLIGYQCTAMELCLESMTGEPAQVHSDAQCDGLDCLGVPGEVQLHVPPGVDLRADNGAFAATASRWGLEELPKMAEIYPLGGAGDRLGLVDAESGESLPAALLPYNGRPLIEGLVRDLTAREWLYYKLTGEHHKTPVAVMTSAAKGNHRRITNLLKENNWFGRGSDNYRLFEQPLVPVISVDGGRWVREGFGKMSLKPGGHGAIWKLMHDDGVFDWLDSRGREGGIVRQITNPMAGTDTTLLSLSGVGVKGNKSLGFASCERHVGASEGVNVLIEKRNDWTGEYAYGVSNIEYTEMARLGLDDKPSDTNGNESAYPANTNVLFIGLKQIRQTLLSSSRAAFPGMLINLTKPVLENGTKGGRLECSMQNIADALMQHSELRLGADDFDDLPTFVLYTLRRRITSSAKKKRPPESLNLAQTPDGSFLDLLRNASDLLSRCDVAHPLPDDYPVERYLQEGPEFIYSAIPSLGPLWDVVQQKIQGGEIKRGSEVRLEVAEIEWKDVTVQGSLFIEASAPLGPMTNDGLRFDDDACGRCRLRNVRVSNAGIDWNEKSNVYWSNFITRLERCSIVLEGSGELDAKDVTLSGDVRYVVPDGKRLTLRPDGQGGVQETWEDISSPSWRWIYAFGDKDRVDVLLKELN